MKRLFVLTVVIVALLASSTAFASFGKKAEFPRSEEFLFADMLTGEFAYNLIVLGQARGEAYGIIRSFYDPLWDKVSQQKISATEDLLMWRTESHAWSGADAKIVGMLHVTFAGDRVVDVLYYSVRDEKTGKHFHKSAPELIPNLNGD